MNSDRQYDRTMELWRSYSIATSLELAAHLENFAILFSYNSGKIEKSLTMIRTRFLRMAVYAVTQETCGRFTRLRI